MVVRNLEGGGVVLHRIFLDDDGIARRGDFGGIQHLLVQLHPDRPEVQVLLQLDLLRIGLVAHDLGLEGIGSRTQFLNNGLSLMVGEGIFRRALGGRQGHRREADRVAAGSVLKFYADGKSLAESREGEEEGQDGRKDSVHTFVQYT